MALSRLFRAARAASEPSSEAVDRVRRRVHDTSGHDPDVAGLLAGVGAPDPQGANRVLARAKAHRRRRRNRRAAGLGLAVAAAGWMVTLGQPQEAPAPLHDALTSTGGRRAALTEAISVETDGRGHVRGTELSPHILWERGTLEVEVDPAAGIRLIIDTPESRVTVLGTIVEVERDPMGTRVTVARGRVRVACRQGPTSRLATGDEVSCWPVTSAGLLGRARTQEARGAAPVAILDTLSRALATEGPSAVRGEILAQQVRWWQVADRPSDARRAARQYLDEGHRPRRDEMSAFLSGPAEP